MRENKSQTICIVSYVVSCKIKTQRIKEVKPLSAHVNRCYVQPLGGLNNGWEENPSSDEKYGVPNEIPSRIRVKVGLEIIGI